MFRYVVSAAIGAVFAAQVQAQDAPLAEVGLQARIDVLAQDAAAHGFEIGLLMSLRAVEKTLQSRYDYGIGDRMNALPLLRLNTGARNPFPKPSDSGTLSRIFETVLADLDAARDVLGRSEGNISPFEMTLQDVWFDINRNGQRDESESMMEALAPMLLGRQAMRAAKDAGLLEKPMVVRFDESDHAWLTAYTHMLSGVGNLFLAFDPAPVFEKLANGREMLKQAPEIPNTFDQAALKADIDALKVERTRIKNELAPLRDEENDLRQKMQEIRALPKADRDQEALDALQARQRALRRDELQPLRRQDRALQVEIRAAEMKMQGPRPGAADQFGREIDAIYVLLASLQQDPDPARIKAARDHWLSMIAQNRVFWERVAQETDNDREWIPNGSQTSVLPVEIDENITNAWQAVLSDAEDVLEGRLLLPHPLLPSSMGINLAAYVEDPAPIDLIGWIHSISVYPYVAKGPRISQQRWLAFNRLTRGNAGGFAFFFN